MRARFLRRRFADVAQGRTITRADHCTVVEHDYLIKDIVGFYFHPDGYRAGKAYEYLGIPSGNR